MCACACAALAQRPGVRDVINAWSADAAMATRCANVYSAARPAYSEGAWQGPYCGCALMEALGKRDGARSAGNTQNGGV